MGAIADIQSQKLTGILNLRIKAEELRFGIPSKFKAIKLAAISVLNPVTKDLKKKITLSLQNLSSTDFLVDSALSSIQSLQNISEDDINLYIKSNTSLKLLIDWAGISYYTNVANKISIICNDQDILDSNIINELSRANNNNSLSNLFNKDSKLPTTTPNKLFSNGQYYPWLFLIYWLILNVQNWIVSTRYPSPNRRKYLQSIIRNIGSQLKFQLKSSKETISININKTVDYIKEKRIKENLLREGTSIKHIGDEIKKTTQSEFFKYKDQLENLLKTLATLDNILIGISGITLIYLENRLIDQSKSFGQLSEISLSNTCMDIDSTFDSSIINNIFTTDNFSCPIITNNIIVPHQPLNNKLNLFDCPIIEQQPNIIIDPKIKQNLATTAVVENLSKDEFIINVTKGSMVYQETLLGSIGHSLIYSPVSATVSNIEHNKVFLSDISNAHKNLLEETTNTLNNSYEEISNIKEFIKSFFIISQLPILLNSSLSIDSSGNFVSTSSIKFNISKIYSNELNSNTSFLESFNNNIQSIFNLDNIKSKAKNNQIKQLKSDFDLKESKLFKNLIILASSSVNIAKTSYAKNNEFILIDFYINLLFSLLSINDNNEIITSFTKHINTFIINRFFSDKSDLSLIINKINDLCTTLNNKYFFELPNFYENINNFYINNNNKELTRNYIIDIGINSSLSDIEKKIVINQIFELFFISKKILVSKPSSKNSFQLTLFESDIISNFFAKLFKKLKDFPKNSNKIFKKLENLAESNVTPIIRLNDNGQEYQWYGVKGELPCNISEEEFTYKDNEYWIKYCSFATIASVLNPLSGWSTGLPSPIGPLKFPVVYIPIKSIEMNWGITLIGLTICGIYVSPMIMYVNASNEYNTPFNDPREILKRNIEKLKKNISDQKEESIKGINEKNLNNLEIDINKENNKIELLTEEKRKHKISKPRKPRHSFETNKKEKTIKINEYEKKLLEWKKTQNKYENTIEESKTKRYNNEKKYNKIKKISNGESVEDVKDIEIKNLLKNLERIENKIEKLSNKTEELERVLIPLPISMKPESVNFGFTIKSPKIMNEVINDLGDNINVKALDIIMNKFEVNGDDYMNKNFNVNSYKEIKKDLKSSGLIIKNDRFPNYNNMSIKNITWNKYLIKEFVVKGAKMYGIPGYPPINI